MMFMKNDILFNIITIWKKWPNILINTDGYKHLEDVCAQFKLMWTSK